MRKSTGAFAILFASSIAHADDDAKVKVEVRGDAAAFLEQAFLAHDAKIDWKALCTTPCTVQIPGDATVRVTANELPSKPIQLEQRDTILRAHVPPIAKANTGNTLVVSGGLLLVYSAIALPIGLGFEISYMCIFCRRDHTVGDWLSVTGGITAIAGAAFLGVGFALQRNAHAQLNISGRGASLNMAF